MLIQVKLEALEQQQATSALLRRSQSPQQLEAGHD
jgi:hypothetical protein